MSDENNEFIRVDGRKKKELRPISIEVGVLDSADGSALVRMGKNIILAAVHGPRELHPKHLALPDRANLRCTYRMSTFSVPERKSPAPSRREKEISKVLTEALESVVLTHLFPRAAIDVYIQVIQADGGTRCASATAAALALADAGIPMRDLLAGVAAGIVDGEVVLDLCDVEDKEGTGDMPIVYSPMTDEISLLQLDGEFTIEQFEEALEMAIEGARKIYEMEKEALINRYKIDLEEEQDIGAEAEVGDTSEIEEISETFEGEELETELEEIEPDIEIIEDTELEEVTEHDEETEDDIEEIEVEIIGEEELEEAEEEQSVEEEVVFEEEQEIPTIEEQEPIEKEEIIEPSETIEEEIIEEEVIEPHETVSEEVPDVPIEESSDEMEPIPLTPGEEPEEEEDDNEEASDDVDPDTLEIAELEDKEEL